MEKKFEKKTRSELFKQSLGQPYGVLLGYAIAANAEIDRLKDRLKIVHNEVSNLMGVIEEKDTEIDTLKDELTAAKNREADFYFLIQCELSAAICVPTETYNTQQWVLDDVKKVVAELTALRSQAAAERVWISSETHETFPVSGIYYGIHRDGTAESGYRKSVDNHPQPGFQYTLILAEKDFPVPPKPQPAPLEVKVGKYHWGTKGKTCHILDIGQKYCLYRFGGNGQAVLHQPISNMQRMMQEADARFIGGGDDA